MMAGAGSTWTWDLYPQDDLNEAAAEAERIGEQVATFIFRRVADSWEKGERPGRVSIIVDVDTADGFRCPKCNKVSHNPNDKREGYCGACHAYTGARDATGADRSKPTSAA